MQCKEKLIILRKVKFGESDLVVHGITGQGISISLMAKGALKSKKRFGGGVLEPSHYINATYNEPKQEGRMGLLTDAQLLEDFSGIRQDYDKLEIAFYFLKTIGQVCQEGDLAEKELFDLLGNTLKALETTESVINLRLLFELKLLDQQGVLPPHLRAREILPIRIHEHQKLKEFPRIVNELKSPLHVAVKQYMESRTFQ